MQQGPDRAPPDRALHERLGPARRRHLAGRYSKRTLRPRSSFHCAACSSFFKGIIFALVSETAAARTTFSCSLPRDSRDMTVPIGISSDSAISLYDISLK